MGIFDKLKNVIKPKTEERLPRESKDIFNGAVDIKDRDVRVSSEDSRNAMKMMTRDIKGEEIGLLENLDILLDKVSKEIKNNYIEALKQSIANTNLGAVAKSDLIKKIGQRFSGKENVFKLLQEKFKEDKFTMLASFATGATIKSALSLARVSMGLTGGVAVGVTAGALAGFLKEGINRKFVLKEEKDVRDALNKAIDKLNSGNFSDEDINKLFELVAYADNLSKNKRIVGTKGEIIPKDQIQGAIAGARRIFLEKNNIALDGSADPEEKFNAIMALRSKSRSYGNKFKGFFEKLDPRKEALIKIRDELKTEDTKKIIRATLVGAAFGGIGSWAAHLLLEAISDDIPNEILSKDVDPSELKEIIQQIDNENTGQIVPDSVNTAITTESADFMPDMIDKGSGLYQNIAKLYPDADFNKIKEIAEHGLRSTGLIGEGQNIDDFINSGADRKMSAQEIADIINAKQDIGSGVVFDSNISSDIKMPSAPESIPMSELPKNPNFDSAEFIPQSVEITSPPTPPTIPEKPSSSYLGWLTTSAVGVGAGVASWLGIKKYQQNKSAKELSNGEKTPQVDNPYVSDWSTNVLKAEVNKKENKNIYDYNFEQDDIEGGSILPELSKSILENAKINNFKGKSGEETPRMIANNRGDVLEATADRVKNYIERHKELMPQYEVKMGDNSIFLSDVYKYSDSYKGVIAYIKMGDRIVARTFYQSNSQGLWRMLPLKADFFDERTGMVKDIFFDKGHSETSLLAPIEIQDKLGEIQSKGVGIINDTTENINLVFGGLSADYVSATEGGDLTAKLEISPVGEKEGLLNIYNPESFAVDDKKMPNFDNVARLNSQETSLYESVDGNTPAFIDMVVAPSIDNEYLYLFCSSYISGEKVSWVGNIYKNNQDINSLGTFSEWVDGGFLTMPAYEYDDNLTKLSNKHKIDLKIYAGSYSADKKYRNMNELNKKNPLILAFNDKYLNK